MQLFSYYLQPFNLLAYFDLLYLVLQHVLLLFIVYLLLYLASQHVLLLFQHVSLLSNKFYRFDDVGLAFLGQDIPKYFVCAQIYMLRCFTPCFHAFMPCLCLDLYAFVLLAMFRCVDLHVGCYVQCLALPFCLLLCLFLVLWPLGRMQIQIYCSRPTSIHLGL